MSKVTSEWDGGVNPPPVEIKVTEPRGNGPDVCSCFNEMCSALENLPGAE